MTKRDGNRLAIDGSVTIATVPDLLLEVRAALKAGVDTLDFTAVTEADSAGLALILAAMREKPGLRATGLSSGMRNLAQLYGVEEIIA